ncbi:MAG: acyltransferase [Burkholderiales bacterium]|nr:acyltransferase [Burkholderiales bacterium]
MRLSDFTQGRDNNFNLIRIVAALAVLVTHSFALTVGSGNAEPLRASLGMTMGSIAVDVFFIASGFLVTASLLNRQSAIDFVWARVLRIFPALSVMLFLTVFGLGAFFTSLPAPSYFTNPGTYVYLVKCISLITGVAYSLPGVFDLNPYKNVVNGSLWTLPNEIKMYLILVVGWIMLGVRKNSRPSIFRFSIVAGAIFSGILVTIRHTPAEGHFLMLFFMFFCGAMFYVMKERIILSRTLFWLFLCTLLISAAIDKQIFYFVYLFTIAYLLFYVAYVPGGFLRKYNSMGDYSYGVYIYAFPVQQSVVALIPGVPVLSMLTISASITLLLAVLSWHFLEQRVLGLKGVYVGHTRRVFAEFMTSSATRGG